MHLTTAVVFPALHPGILVYSEGAMIAIPTDMKIEHGWQFSDTLTLQSNAEVTEKNPISSRSNACFAAQNIV